MDRSWMYELRRDSAEYLARVDEFTKFAESYRVKTKDDDILCPCRDCKNILRFVDSEEIRGHLICRGFKKRYTCWIMHGEKFGESSSTNKDFNRCELNDENVEISDNFELDWNENYEDVEIFDNIEPGTDDDEMEMNSGENVEHEFIENLEEMFRDTEDEISDKNYDKFQNLSNDSKKQLYPGCTKFTKLSAVLKLLNLKADNGWSDKSFTSLL